MCRAYRLLLPLLLASLLPLGACARREAATPPAEAAFDRAHPQKIIFQSDWFPQAEHGGFYQALARGFYAEAGLDVIILSGGPGSNLKLKVARGDADFGLNRSDNIILANAREGLPLLMVAAITQHDHQAVMVHAGSPVRTLADLDGRTVTATLGMAWIPFLQKKYGITFNLRPNNGGIADFLGDQDAIRQCLYTNEPFIAQQQGVRVRTLPLADSGYDAYHVIFTRREFARGHPAATRAFIAASLRGWRDYLEGDPAPADAEILRRNPNMSPAFLAFSRREMISHHLVTGMAARGDALGRLADERLHAQIDTLVTLGMLDGPETVSSVATRDFLPPESR